MPRPSTRKRPVEILFIGNSFTARNDLPGLITALASAAGITVRHRLISAGGASLRTHWNKGEAQAAIRQGGFDYVVLQEQSTLSVRNPVRMHENVRLFDPVIRAAGARTVLYLTWARRNTPEHQALITEAYTSIGRDVEALVVPVGVAWHHFLQKHDRPVLHDRDDSHPTVAGSYLTACVFLMTLFDCSPVGLPVPMAGINETDAVLLQKAAVAAIARRKQSATTPTGAGSKKPR